MVPFRVAVASVVHTLAAASQALPAGVKAGHKYLVVASVDCWLNLTGAAAANTGFYIPAKVPMILSLGKFMDDDISAARVWGSGAGYLHFTPVVLPDM